MSDIPPVDTLLGNLIIDEVFVDYDGPKLFTCIDEYGSFYLTVFADEEEDAEIYLYAEISPAQLDALRTGQVSVREAFENPLDRNLWIVRRSLTSTEASAKQVPPESIDEDWLPSEDARLATRSASNSPAVPENSAGSAERSGMFGEPDSVEFRFFSPGDSKEEVDFADVSMRIGGTELIPLSSSSESTDTPPIAVSEILHNLARAWPFLEWEESSPWGPSAESLEEFLAGARNDEHAASSDLRREREERNRVFTHRHDIARILRGSPTASVLALRKGRDFNLLSPSGSWTVKATRFLNSLEKLGDALADLASIASNPELLTAVDAWQKKRSLRPLRIAEISTGISSAELKIVEQTLGDSSLWIPPGDPASNELYAAARMSAGLNVDQIAQILTVVSSAPRVNAQKLGVISDEADRAVGKATFGFETGYELAEWYRQYLGLSRNVPINPEQHLRSLEVEIRTAALSSVVDAVAVWGPNHGPCIIINSNGQHSKFLAGRRITLAHELGHLLLDRNASLPLAEVLGGRIDESVEARARAFAAELLLPRETAADAYAASPDSPEEVVNSLTAEYGVSREVATWQIRNSAIRLTARGRSVLRSYVKQPGSF